MNCNNCGESFRPAIEGVVISADGRPVAGICHVCCKDVRVAKVVLRRPDVGSFGYEQWSPVEMMRSFPSEHAGKGLSAPIGKPR